MSSEVAFFSAEGARIPKPVVAGVVSGMVTNLGISAVSVVSPAQGHAVLVAAIATPYLVSRCWTVRGARCWSRSCQSSSS